VFAGCAGRDGEEFIEGEDAGLTACPSFCCGLLEGILEQMAVFILYTFLAFVEDGWARMVDARLVRVSEQLAAGFVNAFLRHGSEGGVKEESKIRLLEGCVL
jgi:hypothetical protein